MSEWNNDSKAARALADFVNEVVDARGDGGGDELSSMVSKAVEDYFRNRFRLSDVVSDAINNGDVLARANITLDNIDYRALAKAVIEELR